MTKIDYLGSQNIHQKIKLDDLNRLLLTPFTIPFENLHNFIHLLLLSCIEVIICEQIVQLLLVLLSNLFELLLRLHVRIIDIVDPVRLLGVII